MVNIHYYLNDGANYQAQAILTLIRGMMYELTTMDDKFRKEIGIEVGRYENCREQGYVATLKYNYGTVMSYCFYQHRNSDRICIIKFKGDTMNTPSIETIWEGKKDKWDTDMSFGCHEVVNAAEWIIENMEGELAKRILEEEKKEEEKKKKKSL